MIDEPPPVLPINRNAIISAVAALLTLLSVCTAVAPVPFTGWVCYPAATVLGMVALITGINSLAQIKDRKENGRAYALAGIWVGSVAVVGSLCAVGLGIALFPRVLEIVRQYVK